MSVVPDLHVWNITVFRRQKFKVCLNVGLSIQGHGWTEDSLANGLACHCSFDHHSLILLPAVAAEAVDLGNKRMCARMIERHTSA